jgi:hypothetical protein
MGHECLLMAKQPDGTIWTIAGMVQGDLARKAEQYFPSETKEDVARFLRARGLNGLDDIQKAMQAAIAADRIGIYAENPGNPYRLNRYGCCFGDTDNSGKRTWLVDGRLFHNHQAQLATATLWLALKELGLPDELIEQYIEQERENPLPER